MSPIDIDNFDDATFTAPSTPPTPPPRRAPTPMLPPMPPRFVQPPTLLLNSVEPQLAVAAGGLVGMVAMSLSRLLVFWIAAREVSWQHLGSTWNALGQGPFSAFRWFDITDFAAVIGIVVLAATALGITYLARALYVR